jgi:hypothetical protein
MQGFTTAGRPDSRTAHSALRSVFTDVVAFSVQRELSRARPRLLDLADAQQGAVTARAGSSGSEADRATGRLRVCGSAHRSMRAIVSGTVSPGQLVFRLSARPVQTC